MSVETLPERSHELLAESDNVLILTADDNDTVSEFDYSIGSYNYNMKAWRYDFGDIIENETVTHWMPLPERPKNDSK